MKYFLLNSSVAAIALLSVTGAYAGDYNSGVVTKTPGEVYTDVEYGSGWYLRGDISFNVGGESERTYAPVFGTGFNMPVDYDDAVGARIGFGNYITPNFRLEATAEGLFDTGYGGVSSRGYQGSRTTAGGLVTFNSAGIVTGSTDPAFNPGDNVGAIQGNEDLEGSYSASAFMANAYFDLNTVGNFTPYVGAGIGLGKVNINETSEYNCTPGAGETCGYPAGLTLRRDYEKWRFAYALHAGAAYRFTDNLLVDIGYSYSDFGGGKINYSDGRAVDTNDDGFAIHQVRAGIRYDIN